MSEPVDVCLIDDDEAVLDSTGRMLAKAGLSVQVCDSAEAFLQKLDKGECRCVVSDVKMPGMSGLELQQVLNKRAGGLPLILITGHGDVSMAVATIKAGAADFLEKPFDAERLVEAIRRAIAEGSRQKAQREARAEMAARIAELTPRQREVMDLVVLGYSNKEIAARLGISARTVETYRLWVMERTGARNLAELVRMAMALERVDG
jgi:two-component system, LuxR family, response regulator FixJ